LIKFALLLQDTPRGSGDTDLLQQFKAVDLMPDEDKQVIKKLIDAFITKGKLKQLAL
jgi:hypothetical protein